MSMLEIINEARNAGREAAAKKYAELVEAGPRWKLQDADLDDKPIPGGKTYYMLDLCGFANIHIKNRRGKVWKELKQLHNAGERIYIATGNPYGGWISIFDMTNRQEISVNEAAAEAAAEVLRKHSIDCHVTTRLD